MKKARTPLEESLREIGLWIAKWFVGIPIVLVLYGIPYLLLRELF